MSDLELPVLVLRGLLALMLLAAGAAKLADLGGFAATLASLGLRQRWASSAALGVATAELGVAAVSLTGMWPATTDAAVLGLTLAFTLVAVFGAARRPEVRCRCFGALTSARFGIRTLLRNTLLTAAAALVVASHQQVGQYQAAGPVFMSLTVLGAGLVALACVQAARVLEVMREGREGS
jgi:hypothetical protein